MVADSDGELSVLSPALVWSGRDLWPAVGRAAIDQGGDEPERDQSPDDGHNAPADLRRANVKGQLQDHGKNRREPVVWRRVAKVRGRRQFLRAGFFPGWNLPAV